MVRESSPVRPQLENRTKPVTTTVPPIESITPTRETQPSAAPFHPADEYSRPLDVFVLESCHSTWIFQPRQLRFCRILKGIEIGSRSVATGWRPYWRVQLDPEGEGFTVYLNEAGTRLIRSWRHTKNCGQCGGTETTELSLEAIQLTLHGQRASGR